MIERVLLVAWKGSPATAWVEELRAGGFQVLLEDTTGERAWRAAKERGIDLVIIDGQKKPTLGRQTGYTLRDTAKTRGIPIVWTNASPDDEPTVRAEVRPDALLFAPSGPQDALEAIRHLVEQRRESETDEESRETEEAPSLNASIRMTEVSAALEADQYSHLFVKPRTEEGPIIPVTITVTAQPPRPPRVRAWEPVPVPDQPPPPPPAPAVVRQLPNQLSDDLPIDDLPSDATSSDLISGDLIARDRRFTNKSKPSSRTPVSAAGTKRTGSGDSETQTRRTARTVRTKAPGATTTVKSSRAKSTTAALRDAKSSDAKSSDAKSSDAKSSDAKSSVRQPRPSTRTDKVPGTARTTARSNSAAHGQESKGSANATSSGRKKAGASNSGASATHPVTKAKAASSPSGTSTAGKTSIGRSRQTEATVKTKARSSRTAANTARAGSTKPGPKSRR